MSETKKETKKASKPKTLERFEIAQILRSELKEAEYNPRKISSSAMEKLKRSLRKHGLVTPIIVNKRNNVIVGGHQRINAMDEIKRGKDYPLNVAFIDVDEKAEIEINTLLNNETLQGEFDPELLIGLRDIIPDLDYQKDLGFDQMDLDFMFSADLEIMEKVQAMEEVGEAFITKAPQKQAEVDIEKIKAAKKQHKEDKKLENAEGEAYHQVNDDYTLTIVFNNNSDKHAFMGKIKKPKGERHIKSTVLYDLEQGKYL